MLSSLTWRTLFFYLSETQEEQLFVAVIDETWQSLLIRITRNQPLICSVSFPNAAVVGDIFALSIDAVHLKSNQEREAPWHSSSFGKLSMNNEFAWYSLWNYRPTPANNNYYTARSYTALCRDSVVTSRRSTIDEDCRSHRTCDLWHRKSCNSRYYSNAGILVLKKDRWIVSLAILCNMHHVADYRTLIIETMRKLVAHNGSHSAIIDGSVIYNIRISRFTW